MHGSNKPTKSIIQALYALRKTLSMQTENNFSDDQLGQVHVGMLFLADAVIHGGQFNSINFFADFGCSREKLAEFHKELQETQSIQFQYSV